MPLAVIRRPHQEPYIVTVGSNHKTIMINLEGQMQWEVQTPKDPKIILSDPFGNVVLCHSAEFEIWDKYHDNFRELYTYLEDWCFVKAVSFDGEEIFKWKAPAPLSGVLAIGKKGEVYCVSDGQLWAIG